jgi:CheY-like chemotaxis protein
MSVILVVEDEAQVLFLADSILSHAGYETVTAATLAEAQAIIQSDKKLDLIFTDITLRDELEGGIQVGQSAFARNKLPVAYTSGRPLTDGMKELFVERSIFLPKPYTDEQLMNAISSLLRESQSVVSLEEIKLKPQC